MSGNKEGWLKWKAKVMLELRQPTDSDETAEKRFSQYMREKGAKGHANPQRAIKAAQTKIKNNPNYFKEIGSKGGRAERNK